MSNKHPFWNQSGRKASVNFLWTVRSGACGCRLIEFPLPAFTLAGPRFTEVPLYRCCFIALCRCRPHISALGSVGTQMDSRSTAMGCTGLELWTCQAAQVNFGNLLNYTGRETNLQHTYWKYWIYFANIVVGLVIALLLPKSHREYWNLPLLKNKLWNGPFYYINTFPHIANLSLFKNFMIIVLCLSSFWGINFPCSAMPLSK